MRAAVVVAALAVGCAARQTANVEALIAARGIDGARAELAFRVASHPDDLDARRALALLEDRSGHPTAAIRHLLVVERAGGPLGTRWTEDDRRRLGHLLVRRAWVRAKRWAPAAVDDLAHARQLGRPIDPALQLRADQGRALTELHHAAADVRASGIAWMERHAATVMPDRPVERLGEIGRLAWQLGARRAALELLERWYAAGGRDPALVRTLALARRWWSVPGGDRFDPDPGAAPAPPPIERPPCLPAATADDPACSAIAAAAAGGWELDLVHASRRWPRTADPEVAAAWVIVTLRASLRDDGGVLVPEARPWLALVRARVEPDAATGAPGWARPTLLRAAGRHDAAHAALRAVVDDKLAPGPALVVAAEAALAGMPAATVTRLLDAADPGPDRDRLSELVDEPPAAPGDVDVADVAATAAAQRADAAALVPALARVARAYRRDPALADRRLEDVIDGQVDDAVGLAAGAYLMDGLGDLARARALWQRAVDASREPVNLLELGLAEARAGDDPVALLHLTEAAAAWGDAAPVLIVGARALLEGDRPIAAIEVAHQAADLADPDTIGDALTVLADASTAAGRAEQAAAALAERDQLATGSPADPDDPTDAAAAVAAVATRPEATAIAALVVAARWNPRDVATRRILAGLPATDPRAARARAELARLARDPFAAPAVARAALAALRVGAP